MQDSDNHYSLTTRFSNVKYGADNKIFGVLNLEIKNQVDHSPNPQHFILTVDRSGSMSNREKDGMTKMQHVIHTISNMMRYFAYDLDKATIYISVITFDNRVECIIDKVLVDKSNIKDLIRIVEEIYPRDMTDIGAAIAAANKQKAAFSENIGQTHILLTDGRPTCGTTDKAQLKKVLDSSYRNILIGYGIDHNMELMKDLSHHETGGYYFVESAENAGNVYGEILHGVLNEVMANTVIETDDAEIYDWKTNRWTKTLKIGSLSHGIEKVYHVRTLPDQDDMENILCITLSYTSNNIEKKDFAPAVAKEFLSQFDISKYIYRQKTLELLFKTNAYIETSDPSIDIVELKKNITDLMGLITGEMNTEEELKDTECKNYLFMQNLRDDLHVAEQSLSSRYGGLYLGARRVSQGDQRAYNVRNLDGMGTVFSGFNVDLDDADGGAFPLPALGAVDRTCQAGNYQMSSADASPYACINQQYLMRQCSQEPTCPPTDE